MTHLFQSTMVSLMTPCSCRDAGLFPKDDPLLSRADLNRGATPLRKAPFWCRKSLSGPKKWGGGSLVMQLQRMGSICDSSMRCKLPAIALLLRPHQDNVYKWKWMELEVPQLWVLSRRFICNRRATVEHVYLGLNQTHCHICEAKHRYRSQCLFL